MFKRSIFVIALISALFSARAAAQSVAPEATTQTFQNTAAITINAVGNASPYPSNISVSGVSSFTRMEVRLNGLSHSYFDDLDILLVGPQGQRAILMSDAGGVNPGATNINLTFAQTSSFPILNSGIPATGTFRPANYVESSSSSLIDTFPAPGPGALTDQPADLFVFNGTNPNGVWSLYVVDDTSGDAGTISGGWTLTFTVPQIFTVTKTADTNDGTCNADCSLREAITAAQNGDLINFSSLFNTPQTIDLLTALPEIQTSITIQGTGANLLTVRRAFDAATNFRIFQITTTPTNGVAISGMTISGGNLGSSNIGGAIFSQSHLTLNNVHVTGNTGGSGGLGVVGADGVITNSTFSNNSSINALGRGGAIFFQGDGERLLRIVNSTISGNRSAYGGGGIANISASGNSRLELVNSTITNNSAVNAGGILLVGFGAGSNASATFRNTIVANNSPINFGTESNDGGSSTFQSLGFNLSNNYNSLSTLASDITNATPRLAPLALYGGQTPTHALLQASPAINAGDGSGQTTDQRGVARVFGTSADIGAVEMRPLVVLNNNNGVGIPGSLRNILQTANTTFGMDDILFENGFFSTPQTIALTTGELTILDNANIIAPGANLLTISGTNNSRVFQVSSGITATLSGMTITGGNGSGGQGGGILNSGNLRLTHSVVTGNIAGSAGGGIRNMETGTTTVTNSTISGNTANSPNSTSGGIDSSGNLTVINSTISSNSATNGNDNGGGIWTAGDTTITNSTIANNSAAGATSAGGVFRAERTVTIRNSIIVGNMANVSNLGNVTLPDVVAFAGTGITSNGFNLIGNRGSITFGATGDQSGTMGSPLNPLLGPLQNNGGTIATHALLGGSTALDRGNSSGSTTDQRGSIRPVDLVGITNTSDATDIGAFEAQTAPVAASIRAPFDYDGDNKTDISIFRPGPGEWWVLRSSNGTNFALQFGSSTDKLVPADYTGDNKADVAFWRPSNGNWFILRSEDFTFFAFPFGTNGDVPVPADFDGDNKADYALFRPSTLNWFIQKSTGGTDILTFGAAGDKPVVADYDGDRKADIAIYRPVGVSGSEWWVRRSSNGSSFALQFGTPTDRPVQGDFTGDGKADVAFWRPSNGNWFVLRSEDFSFFAFPFGANGDVPLTGDYDGDGKTDAGVFRPSNSNWFIQRSTAGTLIQAFGIAGDIPTPSAYVP